MSRISIGKKVKARNGYKEEGESSKQGAQKNQVKAQTYVTFYKGKVI